MHRQLHKFHKHAPAHSDRDNQEQPRIIQFGFERPAKQHRKNKIHGKMYQLVKSGELADMGKIAHGKQGKRGYASNIQDYEKNTKRLAEVQQE